MKAAASLFLALLLISSNAIAGEKWATSLAAPSQFAGTVLVTNFGPEPVHVLVTIFDTIQRKKTEKLHEEAKIFQRRITRDDLEVGDVMIVPLIPRDAHRQMMISTCAVGDAFCFSSTTVVDALVAVSGYFYTPDANTVLPIIWEKE